MFVPVSGPTDYSVDAGRPTGRPPFLFPLFPSLSAWPGVRVLFFVPAREDSRGLLFSLPRRMERGARRSPGLPDVPRRAGSWHHPLDQARNVLSTHRTAHRSTADDLDQSGKVDRSLIYVIYTLWYTINRSCVSSGICTSQLWRSCCPGGSMCGTAPSFLII